MKVSPPHSNKNNSLTLDEFEVLQEIGAGSYGKVFKILRKVDQKILVWKVLHYGSMSDKERELLVSEVNIIKDLSHPFIVRYYDRIIDRTRKNIHIIMEYCPSGDLSQFIKMMKKDGKSIDEETIWRIFTQLCMSLKACHCRAGSIDNPSTKQQPQQQQTQQQNTKLSKVIHRDLKPGNIMLDSEYNIKLGDFGLAKILSDSKQYAHTHVGTPYYMSPEQLTDNGYDEKSDIWSLGCVIYELCNLHPPFEATNHLALAMKIKRGTYKIVDPRYSSSLADLISKMLTLDVS
jgi:serine/threonine protein kinase